jgi:hypothetical protein
MAVDLKERIVVQVEAILVQALHCPLKIDADIAENFGEPAGQKSLAIDAQRVREQCSVAAHEMLQAFDHGLDRRVVLLVVAYGARSR